MATTDDVSDVSSLAARVRELEAENARLSHAIPGTRPPHRRRWRAVLSTVLIVIAAILVPVSIVAAWARVILVDGRRARPFARPGGVWCGRSGCPRRDRGGALGCLHRRVGRDVARRTPGPHDNRDLGRRRNRRADQRGAGNSARRDRVTSANPSGRSRRGHRGPHPRGRQGRHHRHRRERGARADCVRPRGGRRLVAADREPRVLRRGHPGRATP